MPTDIVLYNTLGRRLEPFQPLTPGKVRIYACGPTVYNEVHIGNLRTFLVQDLLRRSLRYLGYGVHHVMNLTDVDDKTIQGAHKAGVPLAEYTEPFIRAFLRDLDALHLERVEDFPRATEHIPEMIELIRTLIDKGYAYESEGSVYFSIAKDPDYGRLSGFHLDQARQGERVANDEYTKEDVRDFVLWKAAKPDEPSWDSPWGPGRPGWHVECSAMSMKILGETFDLHCGGVDLIFPHHENEIAQSESATDKPFVRTWLHSEHLIVDNQKMSKSLGNQYTLQDLLSRGYTPRAIRYLMLSVHYRQKLNFTFDSLDGAAGALRRIDEMRFRLGHAAEKGEPDDRLAESIDRACRDFAASLADDLNVAAALAALFTFVKEVNVAIEEGRIGEGDKKRILDTLADLDRVLGVLDPAAWPADGEEDADKEEIDRMVREREEARQRRDFKESDRLRNELTARGIVLEDTPQGTRWKRK
ncbi:MAG TPA: cysteine--tRNA ligase [Thermoanaerobaculia bacterium]|nr:cysteine--tRNA ligase [Thermoanaerobaculia bacterium]